MAINNQHIPTDKNRQRISDLVMAGTPLYIIAEIIGLDEDTVKKYYKFELNTSKSIVIERIAKTVYSQALNGNEKSQALYLKTQGASQGWIEKQVIETQDMDETKELRDKIKDLEEKYQRDY